MTPLHPEETQTIVPDTQDTAEDTAHEPASPLPPDVVPPEITRELAPHSEVRLVYWLRRDYWTKLIAPVVGSVEEREVP